ncbi:MAG: hypothetical protein LBH76_00755 [Propionibacteriaceae bacterium]|nr:hypothetical protein [Propionibacteriaceae bacterium]
MLVAGCAGGVEAPPTVSPAPSLPAGPSAAPSGQPSAAAGLAVVLAGWWLWRQPGGPPPAIP